MPPSKKRKSEVSANSKGAVKHPRQTLDSYFTTQVLAPASSSKDATRRMVDLNAEQGAVLQQVVSGERNLFFTGSAGTGKSLLLRAIIIALKRKHATAPGAVSVTASTGMAASNIGGMTIHAWGAVSPSDIDFDTQISCIQNCRPALRRWIMTKVLIIDEVSMVDGKLFTRICKIAERLRPKSPRPFGGIQLVITGDFFQLPPVTKISPVVFSFESEEWGRCIQATVILSQVFRQKDHEFVDLLNELRVGTISAAACTTFTALSRPLPPSPSGILATELFPLRHEVDMANSKRLADLSTVPSVFTSRDSGLALGERRAKLLEGVMAPQTLTLKVEAQVMLIKNLDERLVNGSVGTVIGFFTQDEVQGTINPLKTGTLPIRDVHLQSDGQTPVPSRSVTEKKQPKAQGKGKAKGRKDEEKYPLVTFPALDGLTTEAVLLVRDEFRVEDSVGKVLARRMQVPLILAWAISIHKSQGQTIQRVKIDLGGVFEKGQSYVALSRAASIHGLQVIGFDAKKVQAHPKVLKWNAELLRNASLANASGPGQP